MVKCSGVATCALIAPDSHDISGGPYNSRQVMMIYRFDDDDDYTSARTASLAPLVVV
jgi:ferredoxin